MPSGKLRRSSNASEDDAPPKKMRKGTHSCLQCRRRKIRCVFTPNSEICSECIARGSSCVSQEYEDEVPDNRKNLRERVGQLERLVEYLAQKVDKPGAPAATDPRGSPLGSISFDLPTPSSIISDPILKTSAAPLITNAPALSLFNNAIIARTEDEADELIAPEDSTSPLLGNTSTSSRSDSGIPIPKEDQVRRTLISLLPSLREMELVFKSAEGWWNIWRQLAPHILSEEHTTLAGFASNCVSNGSPVQVAVVLLCFAISAQQIPPEITEHLSLPLPIKELIEQYMHTVHRLVISDDGFAGTLEGLECMVLQAKLHINLGQPRKGWVLLRRAITFAQLLGIHRIQNSSQAARHPDLSRKRSVWWQLYSGDRYVSLVLGLPYAVSESHCDQNLDGDAGSGDYSSEVYLKKLTVIIGHVIDRNQTAAAPDLSTTLGLDGELDILSRRMNPRWWDMTRLPTDTVAAYFDRILRHFWHYQIKALLHLPFLLQSFTDRRYEYSRVVCLESSREMIRRYQFLREDDGPGTFLCKMTDFQAFTAAVILLLNLLGGSAIHDEQQEKLDSNLVDITVNMLRRASTEINSTVAKQALKVLETLIAGTKGGCDNCTKSIRLLIPYFGAISIGQGTQFPITKPDTLTSIAPLPRTGDLLVEVAAFQDTTPNAYPSQQQSSNDDPFLSFSTFFPNYPVYPESISGQLPTAQDFGNLQWPSMLNIDLDQDWSLPMDGIGFLGV